MTIMYLSTENFTCPKKQISSYLSVHKQFSLSKTVLNQISTLVNSVDSKVGRKIPPSVFTGGIYWYFPAWQIRLKWQILANITFLPQKMGNMIFSCKMQQISLGS